MSSDQAKSAIEERIGKLAERCSASRTLPPEVALPIMVSEVFFRYLTEKGLVSDFEAWLGEIETELKAKESH